MTLQVLSPIDAAFDPSLPTEDRDEYCWTPLQLASRRGDVHMVKQLITNNPSCVNDLPCGYYGQTALQAACTHGHEEVVRLLINGGANIHFCGGNNLERDALQFACGQGNESIVDLLLESGAKVNVAQDARSSVMPKPRSHAVARYNGRTALQAATERGHTKIVIKLLALGAFVNAPASPNFGYTALQAAARGGYAALVRLLLEHGADVNSPAAKNRGLTALQAACLVGDLELINLLLEAGADVDALGGHYGEGTALHAAAEKNHAEVIMRLVEAGANMEACAGLRKQTPIQSATLAGSNDAVGVLRDLGATPKAAGGRFLF